MTHEEKAMQLFRQGYNCAQAVLGAFCEENGMELDAAVKLASPMGGGVGRLREVCGAVSGMCLAASYYKGYSDPADTEAKRQLYAFVQELAGEFKKENGSIVCRELLGLERPEGTPQPENRTPEFYKKRPCEQLVGCAARLLETAISEKNE